MRKFFGVFLAALLLSGCMHARESLVVNEDSSGVVEAHLKVHNGTMKLIDQMLGGMMQAFTQMGQEINANFSGQMPVPAPSPFASVAEQMFSDKKQVLEKFTKAGMKAEFISFSSEKKDDGFYVDYSVKVDNVLLLPLSDAMMTKLDLARNDNGDWYCRPMQDKSKMEDSKDKFKQFKTFKESSQYKAMSEGAQAEMLGAMMDFKVEFAVTLPKLLKHISGGFEKAGDNTAKYSMSMNFLGDPEVMEKLLAAASSEDALVSTDENFAPARAAQAPVSNDQTPVGQAPSLSDKVRVYLKNGSISSGQLLERGKDSIKISFEGIPITYYNDEIDKVE